MNKGKTMEQKKEGIIDVIRRFMQVNQRLIPIFICVIMMLLIGNVLQVVLNYFIGSIIDNLAAWDQGRVVRFIGIILFVQIVSLTLSYLSNYNANKVSEKSVKNIRLHTYEVLMNVHTKWLDEVKLGDIISRVNLDLEAMVGMVNHFLTWEISNILMFVVGVTTCFILNWKLTLFSIVSLPILGALQVVLGKPIAKYSGQRAAADGKANSKFMDLISGHSIAKVFDKNSLERSYQEKVNESTEMGKKSIALDLGLYPLQVLISFVPYIMLYSISVYLINKGEFTLGGMVAFTLTFNGVSTPLNSLSGQMRFIMESVGLANRVFELWSLEAESFDGVCNVKNSDFAVTFEDVKFGYSTDEEDGNYILNGTSFQIENGQHIAIVGNSGGGKSTIIKLLLGTYKNYSGAIYFLGNEVKDWNIQKIRKHVSFVGQNVFLLQDSIYENVKLGNVDATEEEILSMIQLFGLDNLDIRERIGENGIKLSGGQKQRICLARAFMKKADLLILDEPTSALDTESEYYVTNAIKEYTKDKTCIIIAHRLTTVRNADKILCLDNGKIVEEGSFDELMGTESRVRNLFLHQLREENCYE